MGLEVKPHKKKFLEEINLKKGQMNAAAFIVMAIAIIIGSITFSIFDDAASSISTTTAGAASIANITVNTYSGINVVSIGPIVMAAVVVLGIVALLVRR